MSSLSKKGKASWIVTNLTGSNAKTRSLSAYPLGALFSKPMVYRRQSNFSDEESFSAAEDGRLPSFSIGPCYLLTRQNRSASLESTENVNDDLSPVKETYINGDAYVDNQNIMSRCDHVDLDVSNSSTEFDVNHQDCTMDIAVQKVSLQKRVTKRGNHKCKNSNSFSRKEMQNSSKTCSKHNTFAKYKSNKDYCNFSSKKNQQIKHSSNKRKKNTSSQVFVRSNNAQPVLSKSLPIIKGQTNFSPSKMQNRNVKVSSCGVSDGSNKVNNIEKPPNHITKVYLSEKQSDNLMGIPAVPPCTPYHDETCEIEWVPSMSDIKSQRSVSEKLSNLFKKQSKKEQEETMAKEQKRLREERIRQKDYMSNLKKRQRAEIYALNTILAAIEKSNYEKFKEEKGLPV